MSWSDAKRIAREYSGLMLARVREQDARAKGSKSMVKLADFEDDACYRFLKGPDAWPLEFHRMVLNACQREISRAGYKTFIVTIRLPDYWAWLELLNLPDSTENRARYILC